ncbi:transcriptional regulator [Acidocella aquatica]|uniref:Transcriptional regulator n=1 Tax=Acidocella aquatica TaxID=1922313 RepID=A0ABQ6AC82_9PROT|nr:helix-turn-helix domain-containing protein [Acidocella aquatica]GLR69045.1 transcriptional regulator [Acidocella aquatica]
MATALEPNKTKIAKRVIEVFEFFNETSRKATVMDIVRRYGRPQSSTSELLSSLVEMGLLYKDSRSRYYSPTPRLAALGTSAQPGIIRDGRLFALMDRLARTTRNSVALFGMVGTYVQVFHFSSGADPMVGNIDYGASEQLSASTAGQLLLSTLPPDQAGRMLWRLNAEAPAESKFKQAEIRANVSLFRRQGHAVGPAGFAPGLNVVTTLLPRFGAERALALGVLYQATSPLETVPLIEAMREGIAQCTTNAGMDYRGPVQAQFMMAG